MTSAAEQSDERAGERPAYVRSNGLVGEGRYRWHHRPSSAMVWQAVPLALFGGAVIGGIGYGMAVGSGTADWVAVVSTVVGAVVGGFVIGGIALWFAAARMELRKNTLVLSAGQKEAKVPTAAIHYLGAAEFGKRGKWRVSVKNFVVEPGPGLEIVTRDGHYLPVSTTRFDEVARALLGQGMNPDALRVPFPVEVRVDPTPRREKR
ncbi:hypothetical protein [Streptomyces spiramenti]|uniref:Uncharacterized protein n=1 Tax=Streptomyces spiramenti TaxID=2720606 RepID=A0ABX1AT06_9ACTN|nr:hypothetical protein [Streptomyces spiramenti]NJP67370.1 hypothetical protein [Streptomyces spiramenti]